MKSKKRIRCCCQRGHGHVRIGLQAQTQTTHSFHPTLRISRHSLKLITNPKVNSAFSVHPCSHSKERSDGAVMQICGVYPCNDQCLVYVGRRWVRRPSEPESLNLWKELWKELGQDSNDYTLYPFNSRESRENE